MAALDVRKGLVLKGKWTLTNYLAKGACAEIWSVRCDDRTAKMEKRDQDTGWIAKLVPEPPFMTAAQKKKVRKATDVQLNAKALAWEHTLYHSILHGHDSIPKTPLRDDFGNQDGVRFLIMQRLGPNLGEYFDSQGRHLSNAKLASYGSQMLAALRQCHERKLLFVDVKPENFMLDLDDEDKLFIVDFGVADKYIDSKGKHRPQGQEGGSGTPSYMSLACQAKQSVSRRDDIEALAYVLIELLVGELPWANAKSEKDLHDGKSSTDIAALCGTSAAGVQLAQFCEMARNMAYAEDPDYAAFDKVLAAVGKSADSKSADGKSGSKSASPPKKAKVSKESVPAAVPAAVQAKSVGRKKKAVEEGENKATNKVSSKGKKVTKQAEEVDLTSDDDEVVVVEPPPKTKGKKDVSATASSSATVTYTYTAPKRSKRASKGGESDEEEEEPVTYTATVTATATATASHVIDSPEPPVRKGRKGK